MSARWIRVAQYVFMAVGIVTLGYCAAAWISADVFQARKASQFDLAFPQRGQTGRPLVAPREGGVVGKLEIPRLGVSVIIVEGIGAADLNRAVGPIPGTPLPGESGNVGIAGHRDTFFRPLRSIRPNDRITLSTPKGAYCYRVISTKVVTPDDVDVLSPTRRDTLTIVTCFPFYYVGSAPERFIVRAVRG